MSTLISRDWYNTLVDDDGSGTTGSIIDKADFDAILDAIDALFANPLELGAGLTVPGDLAVGGTLAVTGPSTLASLTVSGASTLGATTFTQPITVPGGSQVSGANPFTTYTNTASANKQWHAGVIGNDYQIIETGIAARLAVQAGGNVGIGTANPLNVLHVVRHFADANTYRDVALFDRTFSGAGANGIGGGIVLRATSAAGALFNTARLKGVLTDATLGHSALMFETFNQGTNFERVRIDHAGNVGIGTMAPADRLDVVGGVRLSGALADTRIRFRPGGTQQALIGLSGAVQGTATTHLQLASEIGNKIIFTVNGDAITETMTIDPSGKVGIGTPSPLVRLDLGAIDNVNSHIKFGSAELQSYAQGYISLADNLYYNYGVFRHRATGVAAQIHFYAGNIAFQSSASAAAGATFAPSINLTITHGGVYSQAIYNDTSAVPTNMAISTADGRIQRSTSSLRYKRAVEPLDDWRWLLALTPITFRGLDDESRRYGGLAAEDVAAHSPRGEDGRPLFAGLDADGRPDDVAYTHMVAPLVAAVQELARRLAALEGRG